MPLVGIRVLVSWNFINQTISPLSYLFFVVYKQRHRIPAVPVIIFKYYLFGLLAVKEFVNKSRKCAAYQRSNQEYPYICQCFTANKEGWAEAAGRIDRCSGEGDA